MPFLRFTRDKRGYENTYVMHMVRDRGRARPRILYWFRTPPNVRVGRAALDEDAIRSIEAGHPELAFDWPRILKTQASPPEPESEAVRRRRPGVEPRGVRRAVTLRAKPIIAPGRSPTALEEHPGPPEPAAAGGGAAESAGQAAAEPPADVPPEEAAGPLPASAIDSAVGPEGAARLRARYAELLARISERVADPARREVLRAQAERLDPDTWVTEEEARAGLAGFEAGMAALRAALGRRRRRPRRRRSVPEAGGASGPGRGPSL